MLTYDWAMHVPLDIHSWSDGSGFAIYDGKFLVVWDSNDHDIVFDIGRVDDVEQFTNDMKANSAESWRIWEELHQLYSEPDDPMSQDMADYIRSEMSE